MSILIHERTRLVVQGMTGSNAQAVARDVAAYGVQVVAGVSPGRGGSTIDGTPIFDFIADALSVHAADVSLVFVPANAAAGAIDEAIDAGVPLIVYPGDGLPIADAIRLRRRAVARGIRIVGPNSPGLVSPGKAKIGFMPSFCFMPGRLGVISKSGSLSYEVAKRLTDAGIGQSTVLGIGGDPIKGITVAEALALFHADPDTDSVLVLGEIGGLDEYDVAAYLSRPYAKGVTAFIAGRSAPVGRKMGHASAIIGGPAETYEAKTEMLATAGCLVAGELGEIPEMVRTQQFRSPVMGLKREKGMPR